MNRAFLSDEGISCGSAVIDAGMSGWAVPGYGEEPAGIFRVGKLFPVFLVSIGATSWKSRSIFAGTR